MKARSSNELVNVFVVAVKRAKDFACIETFDDVVVGFVVGGGFVVVEVVVVVVEVVVVEAAEAVVLQLVALAMKVLDFDGEDQINIVIENVVAVVCIESTEVVAVDLVGSMSTFELAEVVVEA